MKLKNILAPLFAAVAVGVAGQAVASDAAYPNKPIRVVFPYPAGSPMDALGRLISERASKILGQPLIYENKPGANAILGATFVSRAAPDGYTVHFTTTSGLMLNSFVRKDLPYDPVTSFTPVTAIADLPIALMVSSTVPANNLDEFVQYAKANPGKLNYASTGNGSFNHILMEQVKEVAGVDLVHVPYQGAAPIVTEIMGNRLDATALSLGSVLSQWKGGQIKVLAFMSEGRYAIQPDIPAIAESFPDFKPFQNWFGIVVPGGTPDPVVNKLSDTFRQVLKDADIIERIEAQQWAVIGNSPEEFKTQIQSDIARIQAAVKVAKIEQQ